MSLLILTRLNAAPGLPDRCAFVDSNVDNSHDQLERVSIIHQLNKGQDSDVDFMSLENLQDFAIQQQQSNLDNHDELVGFQKRSHSINLQENKRDDVQQVEQVQPLAINQIPYNMPAQLRQLIMRFLMFLSKKL